MQNVESVHIMGFGNQAKTWAENLRDSGRDVVIWLRKTSPQVELARSKHFNVCAIGVDLEVKINTLVMLVPDDQHQIALNEISKNLNEKCKIIYAHGYSFVKYQLSHRFPQFEHLLLAPKMIAGEMRRHYLSQSSIPFIYSTEASFDSQTAEVFLKELSLQLGSNNKIFPASFREEMIADLFSEQTLLCGLIPFASLHSYNLLRKNNIPKELAFYECFFELKMIVDTLFSLGPEKFFEMISPNAFLGALKYKDLCFDEHFYDKLRKTFLDIENGSFFEECDKDDLKLKKATMRQFWKSQEMSQVHNSLLRENDETNNKNN